MYAVINNNILCTGCTQTDLLLIHKVCMRMLFTRGSPSTVKNCNMKIYMGGVHAVIVRVCTYKWCSPQACTIYPPGKHLQDLAHVC